MKITTAEEMRTIDRVTSETYGVHSLSLMENAGNAVATFARTNWPDANRIVVICGKGNNGGDGFVAARKLHQAGKVVEVVLIADPSELKGDAANMFARLPFRPVIIRSESDLNNELTRSLSTCDLIIDAMLGTGFHPPVSGLVAAAIDGLRQTRPPVLAVDIPSGADADGTSEQSGLVARADAVVTFTALRPAHVFSGLTSGPLLVAPIGSPDEAIVSALNLEAITARDVAPLLAARALDANKGRFGHALIIAGSLGKSGAAALSGLGALRAGAGLATVATSRSALPMVASFAPEIMTDPLPETIEGTIGFGPTLPETLKRLTERKNVIAIGPGVSRNAETVKFIRVVVSATEALGSKPPLIIDADALNAFEGVANELNGRNRPLVITPHPGEMARLTGLSVSAVQQDRLRVARNFAREHQCIVVLKGFRTIIAQPSGVAWINPTGNPGMATGGTGDVLTGMIVGFIAQFPSNITAAVNTAVFLHGLAGDIAREKFTEQALIASDLLNFVPDAIKRTRQWAAEKLLRVS
jgi:ADP-dependent NAD(P)H-hydrate dehydratase / NAD(P)H-hydrate epimerase